MSDRFFENFYSKFERVIVVALAIAITIAIAYATVVFYIILVKTVLDVEPIWQSLVNGQGGHFGDGIERLQSGLYHVFGGFLLILLGIELISTVRSFSIDNHIKIESIVAISIIATARHLITLDYHHTDALTIFAVGFVVLALIIGYFLLKLKVVSAR